MKINTIQIIFVINEIKIILTDNYSIIIIQDWKNI